MPSVTDIQQQTSKISLNNDGKSTPPPQSSAGMTSDAVNADPFTQIILAFEKKQRNLGKRKDKLESYQQEAKSGKELNKDQKEALAKYGEVLGQIECVKDLHEQVKKIQAESSKIQKRLNKQAAEEKRLLVSQRLREYAQLRYLLDHRPTTLKPEESSLLDKLARAIVPSDISSSTITRSVDIVLAIYQGGPLSSTIKNLTDRSSQEVRDILEQLIKQYQSSSEEKLTVQQTQLIETVKQTPLVPQAPPTTPASVLPQREQNKPESNNNNDALGPSLSHTHLIPTNPNEHPLQFDTRDQNIPYHQLVQDSPFFLPLEPSNTTNNQQIKQDSSATQDNTQIQSNEPNHYLQPFNVHTSSQDYTQTSTQQQQHQGMNNYEQDNSSNVVHSNNMPTDEQQSEEQWHHRRGNSGNNYRGAHYNGNGNKNYNRGGSNNYSQQQWRGPRGGGHHDGSFGGGQRQYNENNNGGRGGSRGGSNPNYRGNRGGSYRGGNRGNGNPGYNGNGYQRSSQYQHEQQ
ncbi:unnamed protein product [Adineta ricciae]|uniref:Uncharacterized protein n=1 Tax=Adineta ricciae TaxID=249248 RepID=A0A814K2P5_ADIRI|nr:unnamed protein product [Adineta ricciae]CAF1395317.1 unnamed protein product [Adineta ricciae]